MVRGFRGIFRKKPVPAPPWIWYSLSTAFVSTARLLSIHVQTHYRKHPGESHSAPSREMLRRDKPPWGFNILSAPEVLQARSSSGCTWERAGEECRTWREILIGRVYHLTFPPGQDKEKPQIWLLSSSRFCLKWNAQTWQEWGNGHYCKQRRSGSKPAL